jgi:hypothetical protein
VSIPRHAFCGFAVMMGLLAGCGKSGSAKNASSPPKNVRQAGADLFLTKPDGTEINLTAERLGVLNEQLSIFVAEHKRMPSTFQEFANTRLDGVPQLPAGFAWDLDLFNRKVIIVPVPPAK